MDIGASTPWVLATLLIHQVQFRLNAETMNLPRGLLDFPEGFAQTEKMTLPASPPAAITRLSSPPETMSNPAPSRAKRSIPQV